MFDYTDANQPSVIRVIGDKKFIVKQNKEIPDIPHIFKLNEDHDGNLVNNSESKVLTTDTMEVTIDEFFHGELIAISSDYAANNLIIEWKNEDIRNKEGFYSDLISSLVDDQVYQYLINKLNIGQMLLIKWISPDIKKVYNKLKKEIMIINLWEKYYRTYWSRNRLNNISAITRWGLPETLYRGSLNVELLEHKLLKGNSSYSVTHPMAGFLIRKDTLRYSLGQAQLLHPDCDLF
jgi:hypothetical protein